jgi:uncharacterized repeat protein (TIGR01451 family)
VTATATSDFAGSVANTATVTAPADFTDVDTTNNSATDTISVTGVADLSITNTDNKSGSTTANTTVTFTVIATNNGPQNVTGATIADTLDANLTGVTWTAVASSGSTVAATSGTGNSISTTADLLSGGTVTFTITGKTKANLVAGTVLTSTATITGPADPVDPNSGNNTAVDTLTLTPQGNLSITMTDDTGTGMVNAGDPVVYTITVTNRGLDAAIGGLVRDLLPSGGLTSFTWTAVASSGASVDATSGTGDINSTVSLNPGATVVYTLTATTDPAFSGNVNNTATITPPSNFTDVNPADNSVTDSVFVV